MLLRISKRAPLIIFLAMSVESVNFTKAWFDHSEQLGVKRSQWQNALKVFDFTGKDFRYLQ